LPGVWANIKRPRAVTVGFMDENSVQIERDFVGLWATSIQHQIDHLNGVMFFDHLSKVKRKMLIIKSQKLAKQGLI
jgi:peptide deformylase